MKSVIIENLIRTGREGMQTLIEHMDIIGYFNAPSSGGYHCSCDGGLMQHSYNVFDFGRTHINFDELKLDINSWAIVSLLHDLGKADYRGKANYIPNVLESGKISKAKPFKMNSDRLHIPHEAVSVFIAQKFIELTDEEEFAMLYHNGMYTALGREIQNKERPLQQILHFCDMYASRFLESKGNETEE